MAQANRPSEVLFGFHLPSEQRGCSSPSPGAGSRGSSSVNAVRTVSSQFVSGALSKMSPVPRLIPVPGWRFGDPERPGAGMRWRFRIYKALRRSGLEMTVRAHWYGGTSVDVTLPSDFGRCLWVAGCFEPNETVFLASVLGPGMTFVDVGANIGLYTLLAAHCRAWGLSSSRRAEPARANVTSA